MYLKDQHFVNQSNYLDTDTAAMTVTVIISFRNNSGSGRKEGRGDKNTNKPNAIVSFNLTDDSNKCSNGDDGSIKLFESTTNNGRASNNNVTIADAPDNAGK